MEFKEDFFFSTLRSSPDGVISQPSHRLFFLQDNDFKGLYYVYALFNTNIIKLYNKIVI